MIVKGRQLIIVEAAQAAPPLWKHWIILPARLEMQGGLVKTYCDHKTMAWAFDESVYILQVIFYFQVYTIGLTNWPDL